MDHRRRAWSSSPRLIGPGMMCMNVIVGCSGGLLGSCEMFHHVSAVRDLIQGGNGMSFHRCKLIEVAPDGREIAG